MKMLRRVRLLAFTVITLSLAPLTLQAQGACGPVILAGHDADEHGFPLVYAKLFDELLANVSNGQSGILCIGADPLSPAATWIASVASLMAVPQTVTYVNDAAIATVDLSPYAIIEVPSDNLDTPGGISQMEADLLTQRAADVASFQQGGGALFGLTQGQLLNGWSWIGGVGAFTHIDAPPSGQLPSGNLFDDLTSTADGQILGITDFNLDGCCFHNVFTAYPSWLKVLAWANEPFDSAFYGHAVFLGGVNLCIDPCPTDPTAVAPGHSVCPGSTITLDGSASTACNASGLIYHWLEGTVEVCPWSATPTCVVVPSGSTTYTLEVACVDSPTCQALTPITVEVIPPPLPALLPQAPLCTGGSVTLDASGSVQPACTVPLEYQFRDSGGIVQAWSSLASYGPFPATSSGPYTVEVRCPLTPGCPAELAQTLDLIAPPTLSLPPASLCLGQSLTIDAGTANPQNCPVPLEYQFRAASTVIQAWSTAATAGPLTPTASGAYTVEVRCPAAPGCEVAASFAVAVTPLPLAAAGPDPSACLDEPVTLSGAGSRGSGCAGGLLYEWRVGATVVRPASPDPTFTPPTSSSGSTTYTLVVSCASPSGCEATDEVRVDVRLCPLSVHFEQLWVELDATATRARVRWTTAEESGTLGFGVERAESPAGPFFAVAEAIEARGSGSSYVVHDPTPIGSVAAWYRVIELTDAGTGDVSRPFAAPSPAGAAGRRQRPVSGRAR